MVERVKRESFWFDCPGFADGFVWCEALEGLQSSAEVIGVDEVGEMPAELVELLPVCSASTKWMKTQTCSARRSTTTPGRRLTTKFCQRYDTKPRSMSACTADRRAHLCAHCRTRVQQAAILHRRPDVEQVDQTEQHGAATRVDRPEQGQVVIKMPGGHGLALRGQGINAALVRQQYHTREPNAASASCTCAVSSTWPKTLIRTSSVLRY